MDNKPGLKEFKIERTKHGLPAIWEKGGGRANSGHALVVANCYGNPKTPIFIKHRDCTNGNHALLIVNPGDYIIETLKDNNEFSDLIHMVIKYDLDKKLLFCQQLNNYDKQKLNNAISAAHTKANTAKCTRAFFVKEREIDKKYINKSKKEFQND